MRWALVDETGEPFATIQRLSAALEVQLTRDYAPAWQSSAIYVQPFEHLKSVPTDSDWCVLAFLKDADQAGALGYHDVTPTGRPYAKVFTGPSQEDGSGWFTGPEAISITASHEILEGTTNPYASWWSDGPGYEKALEACDLVETDAYLVDGVPVSNFLTPRAFSLGKVGPYDLMQLLSDPYAAPRPGCYEIRRTVAGAAYPFTNGHDMSAKTVARKADPRSRTAKILRLDTLVTIHESVPPESVETLRHLWRVNQRLKGA